MTSSRDVAVVIPVRDGAAYLDEALASVFAQTLPPSEVVVVDDGSTDGSADVARAHDARVRVIPQPPLGAGAARNRGVEATTAPWLAFLDANGGTSQFQNGPGRALIEMRYAGIGKVDPAELIALTRQWLAANLGPVVESRGEQHA